jgi:hypothetical protein
MQPQGRSLRGSIEAHATAVDVAAMTDDDRALPKHLGTDIDTACPDLRYRGLRLSQAGC